jgi:shikimate 5-dehydrogenase
MQTTQRYTLADLEKWDEIGHDIDPPIRLGVFGDPVAHSLSPEMQNAALRACEINAQYARFHIRPNELRPAMRFLRNLDFVGVNLTVPHKIAGFAQIDETDDSASRIGAVNTIHLRDNRLVGSNTDGEGFLRAIRAEFSVDVRDLRVMIIGAGGGTGHAIAWQCALENCERLVLVNRTLEKANVLAQRLRPFFLEPRVLGPAARLEAIALEESAIRMQLATQRQCQPDYLRRTTWFSIACTGHPKLLCFTLPNKPARAARMEYRRCYIKARSRFPSGSIARLP